MNSSPSVCASVSDAVVDREIHLKCVRDLGDRHPVDERDAVVAVIGQADERDAVNAGRNREAVGLVGVIMISPMSA